MIKSGGDLSHCCFCHGQVGGARRDRVLEGQAHRRLGENGRAQEAGRSQGIGHVVEEGGGGEAGEGVGCSCGERCGQEEGIILSHRAAAIFDLDPVEADVLNSALREHGHGQCIRSLLDEG